jgi:hypothetical protein
MKKIIIVLTVLAVFCAQVSLAQTASKTSELPSVKDIISKVKNINLPGAKMKSFALDLNMDLPMPLNILCQIRYQAPASFSLHVFDSFDLTPIMIVANQKAVIYDPMNGSVSLLQKAGAVFELKPQGDQYTANFAFNAPVDGKVNNSFFLNFETLFQRVEKNVQVKKQKSGKIYFSGLTAKDSKCTAVYKKADYVPFSEINIFVNEIKTPVLKFSKIEIDEKTDKNWFQLDVKKLKACGIKIYELKEVGMLDVVAIASSIMKSVFARSAFRQKELREKIEQMIGQIPNWEKIAEFDKQNSQKLKKVFQPIN